MNRRQIQTSGGGAQIFSVLDEDSNNEMPDDGWNDTQMAKATNMTNVSQHLMIHDACYLSKSPSSSSDRSLMSAMWK